MKRVLILWLTLLVLASCGGKVPGLKKAGERKTGRPPAGERRGPPRQGAVQDGPTRTVKIVRIDIRQTMDESGELAAATSAAITSRISGRVIRVLVREGARVTRGQVLAMVEPDAAQARSLSDISDRLANARMAYDAALEDYEAQKELFEKGFVSADQFRQAEDTFKRTERTWESSKLEYDSQQRDLGMKDLKVRTLAILAPMSGIVLNRYVEEGEIIAGESSLRSGTKLFTVADLSSLVVRVDVNEVDVYRIEEGLAVSIQVSANPSERYSGRIRKISPYAVNKNGVRMFETEVKFDKPDNRLRPGMTASIRLDIRAKTGVLAAPVTSLFLEDGKEYLMAPSPEGPKKIFVQRGMADENNVEIVSGAAEGTVIYADIPYKELAEKPVFVPEGRK